MPKKIHSYKHLETYRKDLRNRATPAERFLWNYLKKNQLDGKRFLRQHSILNYIVDFYCPLEGIIVELDGGYHFSEEQRKLDSARSKNLEMLGFKILRFTNNEAFKDTTNVLLKITQHFKQS